MSASTEDKINAVNAYVEAFSNGDCEAAAALFADDATLEDPVGTPIIKGHDEIRKFYTRAMASGARLELLGRPRCAGEYVAFPFAVELDINGQDTRIEVIDTFKLGEDGKVVEMKAYWGPENMQGV